MFLWFLIYEVHLLVYPLNHQWVNIIGGFVGAIGTFLVLLGYYKLSQETKINQSVGTHPNKMPTEAFPSSSLLHTQNHIPFSIYILVRCF